MPSQAERIIAKFGGLTAMSRALGHRNPTTVQGWKERGYIPSSQHDPVLAAAKETGVSVTIADFFGDQQDPPDETGACHHAPEPLDEAALRHAVYAAIDQACGKTVDSVALTQQVMRLYHGMRKTRSH